MLVSLALTELALVAGTGFAPACGLSLLWGKGLVSCRGVFPFDYLGRPGVPWLVQGLVCVSLVSLMQWGGYVPLVLCFPTSHYDGLALVGVVTCSPLVGWGLPVGPACDVGFLVSSYLRRASGLSLLRVGKHCRGSS